MADIVRRSVLGEAAALLEGVSDFAVQAIGGYDFLYIASEAMGGVSAYRFDPNGDLTHIDTLEYSGAHGTLGLNQISVAVIDGQAVLLPSGSYDNRLVIHELGSDGTFEAFNYLGASPTFIGQIDLTDIITVGERTYMVASQLGQSGFRSFEIRDNLTIQHKRHFEDTETNHVDDITDIVSATVMGRTYFFTVSGLDDGITSYWMGRWGNIKERDSLSPDDGLWVNTPTALAVVEDERFLFVIVGAAGSNSLSVVKMNVWGGMIPTDHLLDTLDTRFGGVTALDTVSVNGRHFVVAGGADDGLSLLELTLDGRLHHLVSIADQLDTTLQNISALEMTVVNGAIQILAAGSEPGVTQYTVDLGTLGQGVVGNDLSNTLTGTASNDTLTGRDGNDTMDAGAGDDLLADGKGADVMTGGAGADVFVFTQDNRLDRVTDFDPTQDKLDLTEFPLLYDTSRLTFAQKADGVLIEYLRDRFKIEAEDRVLQVWELGEDQFLFA